MMITMDKAMEVNYYARDSLSNSKELYSKRKNDKHLVKYQIC